MMSSNEAAPGGGLSRLDKAGFVLLGLTLLNAAYLFSSDAATIFYHVCVVGHVVLGVPLGLWILLRLIPALIGQKREAGVRFLRALASLAALVMVATGAFMVFKGTAGPYKWWLWSHEISFVVGALALVLSESPAMNPRSGSFWKLATTALALAVLVPAGLRAYAVLDPPESRIIENRSLPPTVATDEGGGDGTEFFPSSVRTVGDRLIPSAFFLESKSCGNKTCHPDIVAQWEQSAHHFASFNNQWYRKSIEYMQDVIGTKPSKWCGGCHDPAILLTGRMNTPIREQIQTPEAQAGIGCMYCHSIVEVHDTMGNAGFTVEYPEMHKLVASENPVIEMMHDYMVRLDPGPHKQTFLKKFHRDQVPEFCGQCHKVHLDFPVNNYRWFRGFDEYDAYQRSGVSHQGALSFYAPPQPKTCGTCHMPLVKSDDAANIDGFVHSHRFPGANTALPFVNGHEEQLEAVKDFLSSGAITMDIFGIRVDSTTPRAGGERLGPLVAPLGEVAPELRPGSVVRVEVVVRTRDIGHRFPGGTIDAFDTWAEMEAVDATGRVLARSGWVEDEGKGPVDENAHFYRAVFLDAKGNRINKRNAWSARSLLYVRTIPPGAADTVHFRFRVPEDAEGPITLKARLNYRKFAWWNTQWAYAGIRDPERPHFDVTADYDNGYWIFTGDTSDVSGALKQIPDLPIVEVASSTVTLPVAGAAPGGELPAAKPGKSFPSWERFNDYGIGLLLQGDLKGAEAAFQRVTELDPTYADGFVNLARALLQEGSYRAAEQALDKALQIKPHYAKAHYFLATAYKDEGRHAEALEHLQVAAEAFPRDRVVLNQIGRILVLLRRHAEAIEELKKVLAIDPEDLQAHYNLMLAYQALGDEKNAELHRKYHERFKLDEAAQTITGPYRLANPADNNERQMIHEHVLVPPGTTVALGPKREAP